jgi:tartrate-resistant acid phosphatase type 5
MRLCALAGWLAVLAAGAGAAPLRFAMIGDFGVDDGNERDVANLVITNFQPEFIVTVGDNNYLGGANIDRAIGKYYHSFIGNYAGGYGAGASSNRFFPALGNHDWEDGRGFAAHTDYFTLPGNERYYDFVRGPCHFFIVNSDTHEPDGATASSAQATWLSNRLQAAVSPWRIVVTQDPPYSSASPTVRMRWPFKEWGASLVVSGHAHHYERMSIDGLPYIVNGAGGASLHAFGPAIGGSLVRYNADHGAMLIIGTHTNLVCEFWSIASGGTLIDRLTLEANLQLAIRIEANTMRLSWPTNGADGLILEAATMLSPVAWQQVSQAASVTGGNHVVTLAATNQQQFFRLRR